MMSHRLRSVLVLLPTLSLAHCVAGCSRVIIATGTTVGLKATPGDGQSSPPQVTLGYKRAESALVPTNGEKATHTKDGANDKDALSTLASFSLSTSWFGSTEVASFIATGTAAQEIQAPDSGFNSQFATATLSSKVLPPDIQARQQKLIALWTPLRVSDNKAEAEAKAQAILDTAKLSKLANQSAIDSLHEYVGKATTDAALKPIEQAFASNP